MKKNLAPVIALGVSAAALTGFASSAQAAPGVYYPNCDAAIAAHAAPILAAEPGYRPALDGDHDGTACDKHLPKGYVKKVATKPMPTKPAPTKSTPATPAPTKPAPIVGTPKPATPAPGVPSKSTAPKPAPSSSTTAGPVVQTDLESQDNAEGSLAVLAGLTLAAGAGAWGLRRRLEQH